MKKRATAIMMIVGLALASAAVFRSTNRADAAAGDCYADSKGPNEPTICN